MNPLKQFRRLRAVPDTPHVPSHSAGDERPSLAVVREMPTTAEVYADAAAQMATWLDDAPPVEPVRVSARPGDPTPIFDAVMTEKWWTTHTANGVPNGQRHRLATQFEVAFILDEFTDDDRAEIAREASADVDFGWGPV